jgi:hypothetical protein
MARTLRLFAAALCLAVVVIHLKDQGGVPGSKDPGYVAAGYYLLEVAGVLAAGVLAFGRTRRAWLLALGVAIGPLVGYVLSRGPGLPAYTDDKGNWTETLGVISLLIEGALLVLSLGTARLEDTRTRRSATSRS